MAGSGQYSYGQLEQLWIQAGGPKSLAPLMAAVAMAESGGRANATNPNDNGGTQTSWGLWQVSDGTHNEPVPGILDPLTNARAAVAKYHSQGLGAWGTYDSGAYRQYYQGNVPPSSLPQGGQGTGWLANPNLGQPNAQLTSFNPNVLAGPQGIIQAISGSIANMVSGALSGGGGTSGGIGGIAVGVGQLTDDFSKFLNDIQWLFVPSHWVRMACAVAGTALLIPGLRALTRTGSGDMSLAMGIALVTLAAGLYFIAFHNLPEDVKDLQGLLGYVSQGIRGGNRTGASA